MYLHKNFKIQNINKRLMLIKKLSILPIFRKYLNICFYAFVFKYYMFEKKLSHKNINFIHHINYLYSYLNK